jgi:hypothetical protein
MFRKALAILVSTAFGISFATATENPLPQTKLSADEVVEKSVAPEAGCWHGGRFRRRCTPDT